MTGRVSAARRRVHAESCPGNRYVTAFPRTSYPCLNCPRSEAVEAALEHLDTRPGDAHGARLIFHDAICWEGGGCPSRDDHARRTQTDRAASLRRFRKHEERTR